MSDPLPTDPQRDFERAPEADREAKIEQLLLTGLEHYFAAEYDQAINVWTRALFLDRSHARARAYIERARTAQAERQRESEELLQDGVSALDRGENREARRLLESALALGAPSDQALAALDRVTRLEQGQRTVAVEERRSPEPTSLRQRPSIAAWSTLGLLSAIIIGAAAFGAGAFRTNWRSLLQRPPSSSVLAVPPIEERLPLPRRGELALTRARTLAANGRLRDALVALEQVRTTDPQRAAADRLKIQIQQQLIELAGLPPQSGLKDAAQP